MTTITVSKEDYLKAIAEAEAEGETVIAATLAHWLSVVAACGDLCPEAPDQGQAW